MGLQWHTEGPRFTVVRLNRRDYAVLDNRTGKLSMCRGSKQEMANHAEWLSREVGKK